jgi:hypothetical protein
MPTPAPTPVTWVVDPGVKNIITLARCQPIRLDGNDKGCLWTRPVRSEPRKGEKTLGLDLYPHVIPVLKVSNGRYCDAMGFSRIAKISQSINTDAVVAAKRVSRQASDWQNAVNQYECLSATFAKKSLGLEKKKFLIRGIKAAGLSSVVRQFKAHVGRGTEQIVWGNGQWARGQRSNIVKRRLLLDPNIRSRLVLCNEANTSCKCANCLDIRRMVHPVHFGKSVWGLYQCQNPACGRTWDRDLGGVTGIYRRHFCSTHGIPLPETYTHFRRKRGAHVSVLGKRSRE